MDEYIDLVEMAKEKAKQDEAAVDGENTRKGHEQDISFLSQSVRKSVSGKKRTQNSKKVSKKSGYAVKKASKSGQIRSFFAGLSKNKTGRAVVPNAVKKTAKRENESNKVSSQDAALPVAGGSKGQSDLGARSQMQYIKYGRDGMSRWGKTSARSKAPSKGSSVVKKALPILIAMLPGGLAAGIALKKYESQTELFNQMNIEIANAEATRAARESFVDAMQSIDAQKWMNTKDEAQLAAQKAMDDYLAINPGDDAGAKAIFDATFESGMQQGLGLSAEHYQLYQELHTPIAQDCQNNIDYWINAGWQHLGYKDDIDAMDKNPELFDAYINDEEWAIKAWDEMVEQVSTYYLDAGVFDVMKSQAGDFANDKIYAFGEATMVTVGEYLSLNPEWGVAGALGVLGVSAAAYCLSRSAMRSSKKAEDGHQEQTQETQESGK